MDITAQLQRDEGLRLRMYADTVGVPTIGYGHNLTQPITPAAAALILSDDIAAARAALLAALPWAANLNEARLGALINMAFNLGIHGLLSFRNTLALLAAGQYTGAARSMLDSKWAAQVGDRAARLAKQIETGEWQ